MIKHASMFTESVPEVVQEMIDMGSKRGYLTYDDLNNTLPDDWIMPDKVDELSIAASLEQRIDDPVRMYLTQMGEIPC
jgi:hypothetical protein